MVTSTQSGRGEAGGVCWQEKKGRQADLYNNGKRERNSKRQAFVINLLLLIIQSKKWTQQRPFNVLPGQKSQKTKICTQDKKTTQHYFRWNWKPFQVAYIIGHEWDGITHVHVCRLCQCLVCGETKEQRGMGGGGCDHPVHPPPPSLLSSVESDLLFWTYHAIKKSVVMGKLNGNRTITEELWHDISS